MVLLVYIWPGNQVAGELERCLNHQGNYSLYYIHYHIIRLLNFTSPKVFFINYISLTSFLFFSFLFTSNSDGNIQSWEIGPPPDLPSLLLNNRIIYVGMPLVPSVTGKMLMHTVNASAFSFSA